MAENDGTFVNTLLSAEQLADFESIREWYGFQSRSETIRYLIRKESHNIRQVARPELTPTLGQEAS